MRTCNSSRTISRACLEGAIKWADSGDFFDCHENYFTPSSFFLLIEEIRYLGFIDFVPRLVTRARGCEFLVVLRKTALNTTTMSEHLTIKKFLYLNMLREQREWLASLSALLDQASPRARAADAPSVLLKEHEIMSSTTFDYEGYAIPIDLANLTGGGPESFGAISEGHMAHLRKHVGLWQGQQIVEIGCGIGRDAIPLAKIIGPTGRYIGADITKPSIEWCQQNISRRYPNFSFVHYDVADSIYNPGGALSISDCRIPVADELIDLVILQSVFTHMLEAWITFYLSEFRRILNSTGRVYAGCFIVDDTIRAKIQNEPATRWSLSFRHTQADGCFVNDPSNPVAAVAYTLPKMQELIESAGFRQVRPMLPGFWSGMFPEADCGQDTMILGREKTEA